MRHRDVPQMTPTTRRKHSIAATKALSEQIDSAILPECCLPSQYHPPMLFYAAIDQREQGNDDSSLQLMRTARELLINFEKRDPFKRDNQINLFKTEVFLSQWGESEFSQTAVDRSKTIFDLYPAYPSILRIVANDMPFLGRDDLATEYNEIIDASK